MPKAYIPNDKLAKRARMEGFRARSVYKLEEIDNKFKLFKSGQVVLDLGAAPGSWLQFVSKKIGTSGRALGLDLKEVSKVSDNVKSEICDITDFGKVTERVLDNGFKEFDLVISDLAPNTSGIKEIDQARSVELDRAVFKVAKEFLKKRGSLLMKVFQGEELNAFLKELRPYFKKISVFKSQASRDRSREVYIICR